MFSWWKTCVFFSSGITVVMVFLWDARAYLFIYYTSCFLWNHYTALIIDTFINSPTYDLRSTYFSGFGINPFGSILVRRFIIKSWKILYLQFLELHATLPLIGDGWMHLLQNWCFLSSFKQQNGRGFLNKMYMLMHSFKMWRATNKLNYSSELFETKWKAVPFRCLQANSTVFLWP